ncbi:hypothetical protein [Glycomyces salinus]|uniref:hypothetical protein n=1 Tax=Glycomyces salinus TaxID=980294 RepID=UPI0018ECED72|nr:hypothetical protein [Glycomyces salinus]
MRTTTTRRTLLVAGASAASIAAVPGAAFAEPGDSEQWTGRTSQNGWDVLTECPEFPVEGTPVKIRCAPGFPAETILYFLRRFHTEVMPLKRAEDARGFRERGKVAAPYESNYFSGTGFEVFPDMFGLGSPEEFFPWQVDAVRKILGDLEGALEWGAELDPEKVSHFHLAAAEVAEVPLEAVEDLGEDDAEPSLARGNHLGQYPEQKYGSE